MSTIIHKAVIVTTRDYNQEQYQPDYGPQVPMPDVEAFLAEMPEDLRPLVVGPIPGVINGFVTYFWAPSGSKSVIPLGHEVDQWRQSFIELWSWKDDDDDSPYDVVAIEYGEDWASDGKSPVVTEPYAWYAKKDGNG